MSDPSDVISNGALPAKDPLARDASHDRSKSNAFGVIAGSHADDPNAHPETRGEEDNGVAPADQMHAKLESLGPAETTSSAKFMASLEQAKEAQEESNSTGI